MKTKTFAYFLFFLSFIIFTTLPAYACPLKITIETSDDIKEICPDTQDATDSLQSAINYAFLKGGGIIYLSPGAYELKRPVYLKSRVSILGKRNLTTIHVSGVYGFTQKNEDIIEQISIKDITFNNKSSKTESVFFFAGGLQYSTFENLTFHGFDTKTLINLAPDFDGAPPRNIIFNSFKNIYADICGKCVVYKGSKTSRISNNRWYNIIFRKVTSKAIEAVNYVDTEVWYNMYAMAENPDVIIVDINPFNLEHAHGFHFYSPTLVYSPKLFQSGNKPVAIRLGKRTIRNIFLNVATDKEWDNFVVDNGADSYYILIDRGIEKTKDKKKIRILQKGVLLFNSTEIKENGDKNE